MRRRYLIDGQTHDVVVTRGADGAVQIDRAGRRISARAEPLPDGRHRLTIDGREHAVWIASGADSVFVHSNAAGSAEIETMDPAAADGHARAGAADALTAPMPGTVIAVHVAVGDAVVAGQALIVIESMKLETTLIAPRDGCVRAVHFGVGSSFGLKAALVTLADA